jgi:hypothetical protein
MPKVANKFELSLGLQEIVVLFFVMVALFTGLLFFGYRVGNAHNRQPLDPSTAPVAPAQEGPRNEQEAPPTIDAEPEIRLENQQPGQLNDLLPAANPEDPEKEKRKPLARVGERPRHPCKADAYWSFLRKTLPSRHRFFERVADWAGIPPAEDTPQGEQQRADESGAGYAAGTNYFETSGEEAEAVECGPPPPRLTGHSVAC